MPRQSARIARKHRAWGVNPRTSRLTDSEPAERATADGSRIDVWWAVLGRQTRVRTNYYQQSAVARAAGCNDPLIGFPGLTPRALCFHALRALSIQVNRVCYCPSTSLRLVDLDEIQVSRHLKVRFLQCRSHRLPFDGRPHDLAVLPGAHANRHGKGRLIDFPAI